MERLEGYRSLRIRPRSTPVLLEKGFYTDSMAGFTPDGEMLVTVELPTTFSSGTDLDRMQDLVIGEVIKNMAGKGLCPQLDEEYTYLKKIESGIKGSSRLPSFKLDARRCFRMVKRSMPGLNRLENKRAFKEILTAVQTRERGAGEKAIHRLMFAPGQNLLR